MKARRFWTGVLAGGVFVVVELLARVLADVPTIPELVEDRLVLLLPGPLFSLVLDQLYYLGKPLLFGSLLVLQLVLGGVGGLLARNRRDAVLLALVLWLITNFVVFPLAQDALFAGSGPEALTTFVSFLAYAGSLLLFRTAPRDAAETRLTTTQRGPSPVLRRQLLGGALLLVLGGVLARRVIGSLPSFPSSSGGALATSSGETTANTPGLAGLPAPVTSPQDFYEVSKNLVDPTVDGSTWKLQVDGMVNQAQSLTLADLQALPAQQRQQTLECISNEIGGNLISNGQFTGVRLADVLALAGPQAGATTVNFTSADGYAEFLPLTQAMDPQSLLVYQLDGQPLPTQHGFPLRVLTVGTYGMKNPKWLTHIQVVSSAQQGFWEQQGWDPAAPVQTMSAIDTPSDGSTVSGVVTLGGVAFAGNRGIQLVEVSVDGGQTWTDAQLFPAPSPLTWVLWEYPWQPSTTGTVTVTVRATDGTGQVQTSQTTDSFPSGASGLDTIRLHATA